MDVSDTSSRRSGLSSVADKGERKKEKRSFNSEALRASLNKAKSSTGKRRSRTPSMGADTPRIEPFVSSAQKGMFAEDSSSHEAVAEGKTPQPVEVQPLTEVTTEPEREPEVEPHLASREESTVDTTSTTSADSTNEAEAEVEVETKFHMLPFGLPEPTRRAAAQNLENNFVQAQADAQKRQTKRDCSLSSDASEESNSEPVEATNSESGELGSDVFGADALIQELVNLNEASRPQEVASPSTDPETQNLGTASRDSKPATSTAFVTLAAPKAVSTLSTAPDYYEDEVPFEGGVLPLLRNRGFQIGGGLAAAAILLLSVFSGSSSNDEATAGSAQVAVVQAASLPITAKRDVPSEPVVVVTEAQVKPIEAEAPIAYTVLDTAGAMPQPVTVVQLAEPEVDVMAVDQAVLAQGPGVGTEQATTVASGSTHKARPSKSRKRAKKPSDGAGKLVAAAASPARPAPKAETADKPTPKVKKTSPKEKLAQARTALSRGEARKAYVLASSSYRGSKSSAALEVMGVSACRMKDAIKARAAVKGLSFRSVRKVKKACRGTRTVL